MILLLLLFLLKINILLLFFIKISILNDLIIINIRINKTIILLKL